MTVYLTAFPGTVESVAAARRFMAAALRITPGVSVPETVIGDAELIISELATNAVQHTRSGDPGQTYKVRIEVNARGVAADVRTKPPRLLLNHPHIKEPDCCTESGRGLHLVACFATEWGPLPFEDGVFFTLPWQPAQAIAPHLAEPVTGGA
ncbi:anti-sigma regulatory factor (Ser/Thr protein kinase) [Spinactinospora alkalitolerans]|uniref:Anti-sigma regulatory factor (Ser/Thr protein kinase) n=1 Tax=Spinactinospora alkalitolerans TaxID=687207 RepID=A0A852U0D1_9ACTN|nr:ATP-binding protein [Spinactinospora alkalitolerans]NYE49005.1 anti-sigma regulatory factor (Ser/Thr protein kinase) [Spinactinospora alkalitolerans]